MPTTDELITRRAPEITRAIQAAASGSPTEAARLFKASMRPAMTRRTRSTSAGPGSANALMSRT